jgi:hypothetical protein
MWSLRRRRRPEATGTLRIGDPSPDPSDYRVFTVSESRYPDTFDALFHGADDDERTSGTLRRWGTLVPIRDPRFGVAELAVEFDGLRACYLRPPHLGRLAARIDAANVATLEVPALITWGPAGPSVTLRVEEDSA